MSRVMGWMVWLSGGCVWEWCRALRCSVSWKAESMSESSIKGGPSAMSSAFVPGRIRLDAPELTLLTPGNLLPSSNSERPGDVGPSWSSAMGGGEGRRGEEDGETAAMSGGLWSKGAVVVNLVSSSTRTVQVSLFVIDVSKRCCKAQTLKRSSSSHFKMQGSSCLETVDISDLNSSITTSSTFQKNHRHRVHLP